MSTTPVPIFDGHNDFLYRLRADPAHRRELWLKKNGEGHLDLPRMRQGCMVGGFFAIYVPSADDDPDVDFDEILKYPPYDISLPPPMPHAPSQAFALSEATDLFWMERVSDGAFKICRSGAELRATIDAGNIGAIMHMEGAEAIDEGCDALFLWHEIGLRSLGPVWSRPTVFGHGVPFRFPGSPDTGPGLTNAGKRLVETCDALGILVDLSHLNEKGVDDVARISSRPLMATHSNAHSVTASTRNLTDRQLELIASTGGIVGLNFGNAFLRSDGANLGDCGWDVMLRHLDHLLSTLGEDGVAFGSDFDGVTVPDCIKDVTGVQDLCDAMIEHGFGETLTKKIASENWIAFLERNLN